MALRSKNVPARPAPAPPAGFSGLKSLFVPNGAASSAKPNNAAASITTGKLSKKNPPPRPPPPKVIPQHLHRSSSLERPQVTRNALSYHAGMPPPISVATSVFPSSNQESRPKLNQDLQSLIDLFSSPPPSSSSSSPTLTHHSGSDGFSVNSLTMEEDFDPFSPRSLASKQKDTFNKIKEDSVLTQFKPDSGLQRQYALLYGQQQQEKSSLAPTISAPPKSRKPTVIRTGHPPVAAKPPSLLLRAGSRNEVKLFGREPSPPEPAAPPPKPPDLSHFGFEDAPPALPPRRPHSEEPFNTDEPHAIVLFDYEKTHPDDLGCVAGELVYLVARVDKDWYSCRKRHGAEEGMIPASFLDVLSSIGSRSPRPAAVTATALYEFASDVDGDLSFPEGAMIVVESRINEEWLFGSYAGKLGQFPASFVTPVTVSLPSHVP